jgi:exopolysaccharide biosynthesis polyprenyl glycosylphosphotransferase
MRSFVSTEPLLTADRPDASAASAETAPPVEDIRSARPYILSGGTLRNVARRLLSILALVFLDLSGVALGLYGALTLRELVYGHYPPLWGVLWQAETSWFPFLGLVTVLVFWRARLYAHREIRSGFGQVVSSLILVMLLALAFAIGTGHDFTTFGLAPTALVLTTLLIGLFRASYDAVTRDLFRVAGVRRRAVLVGEGEGVAQLRRTLGSGRSGIEYEFVGSVPAGDEEALAATLAGTQVDELIVADSGLSEQQLLDVVELAHRRAVKVRVAPKTTELLVERGQYVPGQGVPLFELRPPVFAGTDWVVKRGFDLIVGSLVIVVGLPLWLLIAAAIELTSKGPVFYADRRIGLGEREFGMLKFRTMRTGAAALQSELEQRNEADGPLFKIRDDPRVTPVGRALRRLSLDEIPNIVNVLRGEMSLVGPRPLPLRDYALLEQWHRKRYLVLPGMTGLWQISGRSSLSFDDLVRLDFYYLENWSIWLDITILVKTIPAVLRRRGAY